MDEISVVKRSFLVFIFFSIVFSIAGIFFQSIAYLLGFILGYVLDLVQFYLIIKTTDLILDLSSSSAILVFFSFILKLAIYAFGFIVAALTPWFSLLGVFVGYMVTRISIYIDGYLNRGGEVNDD